MIYLDYAANTPTTPEVLERFCNENMKYFGNPNSPHSFGREAKSRMDQITEDIANLLDVNVSEIIYTSGASESNNLAIKGVAKTYKNSGKHIISTCLEHSSVSGSLTSLQEQGYEIDLVDITSDGIVDLQHFKELLRKDTVLVSICYVDSELGVRQPIEEIGKILAGYPDCFFHVDATQAVGKIPVSFENIDLMSFAPHKFYGLNGCGVLLKREHVVLDPLIHGGLSTTIYRSGTPALALASSIEVALTQALNHLEERYEYVKKLNEVVRKKLEEYPLVRINSTKLSTPFILNVSVKDVKSRIFQEELDKHGICVTTKSACSVPNSPSRPVYAVSKDKKNARYSWRVSFSHLTTEKEIEEFLQKFDECYNILTN